MIGFCPDTSNKEDSQKDNKNDVCGECGKYKATENGYCQICNYRMEHEMFLRTPAFYSLQIPALIEELDENPTQSNKSEFEKQMSFFMKKEKIKDKISKFYSETPPTKAIPIETGVEEDVSKITRQIKKKTWWKIRKSIGNTVLDLIHSESPFALKFREFNEGLFEIVYKPFPPNVMISICADWIKKENGDSHLKKLGFEKTDTIDLDIIGLEICSGYYSYIRGDERSRGMSPSVFDVKYYDFSQCYRNNKNNCQLGISEQQNRTIAHFCGSDEELMDLWIEILKDSWIAVHTGSFITDAEIARLWWTDKRKIREPILRGNNF